jgi:hypothetical protein
VRLPEQRHAALDLARGQLLAALLRLSEHFGLEAGHVGGVVRSADHYVRGVPSVSAECTDASSNGAGGRFCSH